MSTPRIQRKSSTRATPQSKTFSSLAKTWTARASECNAAAVHVVNETGQSAGPPTPLREGFEYLEIGYVLDHDVVKPDPAAMKPCNCSLGSCNAETCSCVRASRALNTLGRVISVYGPDGLFILDATLTAEIQECNANCGCTDDTCLNRVSQKPRDFDVTIANTNEGWTVRTNTDLPKGKVLGIYTGLLIRRSKDVLDADNVWVWDLDGPRNLDAHTSQNANNEIQLDEYSVYCKAIGNWTKYLKNSENPNLKSYAVLHDTPAGSGMPFLAFVAKEDIAANTELSINYSSSDERFANLDNTRANRPSPSKKSRSKKERKGKRAARAPSVEC